MMARPTLHDRIERWALRLAKSRKSRYQPVDADRFYDVYFNEEHVEAYQRDVRQVLRRQEIASWLASNSVGGTVIDIGCGVGDVLQVFGERFRRIGVDYTPSQLRYARATLGNAAHFAQASACALPFPDNVADVVVCLEVLEHLENDALAVGEIRRVLKPGGYFIAAVPYHFYWPEYRELLGHWRHYSREGFETLLAHAGLQTVCLLRGYPRLQRRYFYTYIPLKVASELSNRVRRQRATPYSLQLPGSRRPLYDRIAARFLKMAAAEKGDSSAAEQERGTFVVARKEMSQ